MYMRYYLVCGGGGGLVGWYVVVFVVGLFGELTSFFSRFSFFFSFSLLFSRWV